MQHVLVTNEGIAFTALISLDVYPEGVGVRPVTRTIQHENDQRFLQPPKTDNLTKT